MRATLLLALARRAAGAARDAVEADRAFDVMHAQQWAGSGAGPEKVASRVQAARRQARPFLEEDARGLVARLVAEGEPCRLLEAFAAAFGQVHVAAVVPLELVLRRAWAVADWTLRRAAAWALEVMGAWPYAEELRGAAAAGAATASSLLEVARRAHAHAQGVARSVEARWVRGLSASSAAYAVRHGIGAVELALRIERTLPLLEEAP